MNRVAVFGNTGGGKSTLSLRLADITGLPLHVVDLMQFREGRYWPEETDGGKLPFDVYLQNHRDLLASDRWIVDGFDTQALTWERFAVADTLVYVDLPFASHLLGVTQRLVTGHIRNPKGWPTGSPLWKSTLSSYRVLRLCHRYLTPKYRELVTDVNSGKRVHHLKSRSEIRAFLEAIESAYGK
jgi:adenylate kinase family enzyme